MVIATSPSPSRPRTALSGLALALLIALAAPILSPLAAQPPSMPSSDELSEAEWERKIDQDIREALTDASYPWYDAENDLPAKLIPPRPPEPSWLRKLWDRILDYFRFDNSGGGGTGNFSFGLGEILIFLIYAVLTAGLITLFVYAVRHFQNRVSAPISQETPTSIRYEAGKTIADLLGDAFEADSDPWETAQRKRAQGRLGEAVVALFAHLLELLERSDAIRITPGRTPRQLVRSLADPLTRSQVQPALHLFEAFAFGHHDPDPQAFAFAWSEGEALRDRLLRPSAESEEKTR